MKGDCPTCHGSGRLLGGSHPGEWWDEPCPDCTCACYVTEPDEFGNRDLIESPDCPVHGEENK